MDVSGRLRADERYLKVAAAVAAHITATRLARIQELELATSDGEPTLPELAASIDEGHLGDEFTYVEPIAEREMVAVAHHAAYTARNLPL